MESSSVEAGDLTGAFRTYVGVDLDTAVEIIYRRAVRLSEGEAQAAQDLTQDVLAKIVSDLRAGTLAPVVEPRPWLRTLVNNQFIQHLGSAAEWRADRRIRGLTCGNVSVSSGRACI